jgi:hypothetical protein
MNVAIGEAGKDKSAAGVDDLGADATETAHDEFRANRGDFALANSDGVCPGLLFISGENFCTDDENISGSDVIIALGECGGRAQGYEQRKN